MSEESQYCEAYVMKQCADREFGVHESHLNEYFSDNIFESIISINAKHQEEIKRISKNQQKDKASENKLQSQKTHTKFFSSYWKDFGYDSGANVNLLMENNDKLFSLMAQKKTLGFRHRISKVDIILASTKQTSLIEANSINHAAKLQFVKNYFTAACIFSDLVQVFLPCHQEQNTLIESMAGNYPIVAGNIPYYLFDRLIGILRLTKINSCYNTNGAISDDDEILRFDTKAIMSKKGTFILPKNYDFMQYINRWVPTPRHLRLLKHLSQHGSQKFSFHKLLKIDRILRLKRAFKFNWCLYFDITQPVIHGYAFDIEFITSSIDLIREIPCKIVIGPSI